MTEQEGAQLIDRAFELWDSPNDGPKPFCEEDLRKTLVQLDAFVTEHLSTGSEVVGFAVDVLLSMAKYAP